MLISMLIGGLMMFFAGVAAKNFQITGSAPWAVTCVIEMAMGGYFLVTLAGMAG